MPQIELSRTPLAPGITPVRIHYRHHGLEPGDAPTLLFLHGGWGYQAYPIDEQIRALETNLCILIPDRTGYGRSTEVSRFPQPLHRLAAEETLVCMDALSLRRCVLWGHSDGAVIAANVALAHPDRVSAVILESCHLDRRKAGSVSFFQDMATDPGNVGPGMRARLAADHGKDRWEAVLRMEGQAWLEILAGADRPEQDLFGNRLEQLQVPALILHGRDDPRTEPDELEALARVLPAAQVEVFDPGGHCPHGHPAAREACTGRIQRFLA